MVLGWAGHRCSCNCGGQGYCGADFTQLILQLLEGHIWLVLNAALEKLSKLLSDNQIHNTDKAPFTDASRLSGMQG